MKVNRFGMSQSTFVEVAKAWVNARLDFVGPMIVFAHRENGTKDLERAEKILREIRDVLARTFIEKDEEVQDYQSILESLEWRLTQEQAALA